MYDAIIVGGGLAGLSAAHRLRHRNIHLLGILCTETAIQSGFAAAQDILSALATPESIDTRPAPTLIGAKHV